jgi:hypothetical protein
MVDISSLANMFSQKTGAQSSVSSSVMNAVVGFMAQKGIGSMLGGGQVGQGGGIMSAFSNILGGGGSSSIDENHELVSHVQQSTGIQDKQQATQYTRQALDVMNEHGNNNPQGLQSMFSGLTGGGQNQGQQGQQNTQKKKGLLGDVMGGLGI